MMLVAVLAVVLCRLPTALGLGAAYSLVVLGHEDIVSENAAVIWDSDDSTCFSMPSEVNETLASVRLFLNPPVDIGLTRVVSEPQPNVVYYLLTDNSNGFPTAERDDLEGNVWIYDGKVTAKVRGVDIHGVTKLCEVSIFNISEKIDVLAKTAAASKRAAASQQPKASWTLSWQLILYAALPLIATVAILLSVLFWKRRKVPCPCVGKASGLPPVARRGRRPLPLTPDDEEDDSVTFVTSDTAALFHSRISPRAEWTEPQSVDGHNGQRRDSDPDIISDIAFVNHLLEVSHEYATLEPPTSKDSCIKYGDV
ncbi:uncharacterized protein LOC144106224 isoform X1 [Amblyomma americanum]